jgi:hypothetical protein
MSGIRIQHATARSVCHVVPVLAKPYADGGFKCPTCQVWHPVKAVHLWLNDVGDCLVSPGVLAELRLAGMPGLTVVGEVVNPPPLQLGVGVDRAGVDQTNRRIIQYQGAGNGR